MRTPHNTKVPDPSRIGHLIHGCFHAERLATARVTGLVATARAAFAGALLGQTVVLLIIKSSRKHQ